MPFHRVCKLVAVSAVVIVVILFALSGWLITKRKSQKLEVVPIEPWEKPRLSPEVQPYLYNLHIHPNLRTSVFKGKVTILLTFQSAQEHLAVHIKGLQITKTELTVDDEVQNKVELRDTFEYEKNEFWVMLPEHEIQPGKYKLFLEFNGKLTNKIIGFYQSVYKNSEGEERRIATTKFEPTFARQAFPCLDEPNFKAKYNIELVKPSTNDYIALSNMNIINQEINQPEVGLTTIKFATSLPMSTYLACFIICDFDHLEPVYTDKGLPITVYARKEYVRDVAYARNVALVATNFYVNYFHIDYPLPKLDLIAIPDFVSGAMENWGLITFRETRLLCANDNSSIGNQLAVALTVSHEIAHMWFGDLVTMKWWNDLWLNEGFATFVEYKATAQVHPHWELDNIFLSQELYHVLKLDATLSSHPIVQPVSHPDQITEIFDSISYNKGASVLRMLEATIGEENFRQGITSYMNKFKYSNAETQDLWNHLNEFSSGIDVTTFMNTWTRQMGFPLISVVIKGKQVIFTQKRYLIDPTAEYNKSESPFNYRWEVPITFFASTSARTIHKIWMKQDDEQVVYDLPSEVDWIKVNYHHIGYYMVNYELSVWDRLVAALHNDYKLFDPADRAELLNDAFSLAESEAISYEVALKMTQYLPLDTHYTPWSVAYSQFLLLSRRLYGTTAFIPYMKYVNSLIKDLKVMSWELDDRANYLTKSYQNNILHLGCLVGNTMCLNQTASLFKQWLSIPAMKLNPELVQIIMYFGIQQTGTQEWDSLWELYLKEQNPQDKVKMMKALCASRDADIIKRYMQLGKNESFVRSQDYLTLLITLSNNPTASPLVWEFVTQEWEFLVNRYTINDRYLGRLVPDISYYFATETRYKQLKDFFEKYPEGGAGTSARKIALERITNNIKWRNKHITTLTEWFNAVTANA